MANYRLDGVFAALADDTRRSMVADVAAHGARTAGELAAPHPISLPAASKHLAVLQRVGLLTRERRGRNQVFTLNPQPLRDAADWLDRHHRFWTERFDALDQFLHEGTEPSHEGTEPSHEGTELFHKGTELFHEGDR